MSTNVDWTSTSCHTCDWKADRTTSRPIKEVVERYGEVANFVNQREFERFIEDIRKKWNPLPPTEDEWEPEYRAEGWTEEGAFAMCVFQEAMGSSTGIRPERQEPLCEAERKNQVLFRSMSSLLKDIRHGPLFDPQPTDKITEALDVLKAGLQRQANETVPLEPITVDLPKDLAELMQVSDGVSGAGIPSETADTYLIPPLRGLRVQPGKAGEYHSAGLMWQDYSVPFAAFELGGCIQHRQIYYVLCRDADNDAAPVAWKVFDRDDVELGVYDSLTEFLEHETIHIEQRPGGHKQEHVLIYDRYPSYEWDD